MKYHQQGTKLVVFFCFNLIEIYNLNRYNKLSIKNKKELLMSEIPLCAKEIRIGFVSGGSPIDTSELLHFKSSLLLEDGDIRVTSNIAGSIIRSGSGKPQIFNIEMKWFDATTHDHFASMLGKPVMDFHGSLVLEAL